MCTLHLNITDVVNLQTLASEALTTTTIDEVLRKPSRFLCVIDFASVHGNAALALHKVYGIPTETNVDVLVFLDFVKEKALYIPSGSLKISTSLQCSGEKLTSD